MSPQGSQTAGGSAPSYASQHEGDLLDPRSFPGYPVDKLSQQERAQLYSHLLMHLQVSSWAASPAHCYSPYGAPFSYMPGAWHSAAGPYSAGPSSTGCTQPVVPLATGNFKGLGLKLEREPEQAGPRSSASQQGQHKACPAPAQAVDGDIACLVKMFEDEDAELLQPRCSVQPVSQEMSQGSHDTAVLNNGGEHAACMPPCSMGADDLLLADDGLGPLDLGLLDQQDMEGMEHALCNASGMAPVAATATSAPHVVPQLPAAQAAAAPARGAALSALPPRAKQQQGQAGSVLSKLVAGGIAKAAGFPKIKDQQRKAQLTAGVHQVLQQQQQVPVVPSLPGSCGGPVVSLDNDVSLLPSWEDDLGLHDVLLNTIVC